MKKTSNKPANKIVKRTGILQGAQKFSATYTMSVKDIVDSLFETHVTMQDALNNDEDFGLYILPITKMMIKMSLTEKICMDYVKQELKDVIACEKEEDRYYSTENNNAAVLRKLRLVSKAAFEAYNPF